MHTNTHPRTRRGGRSCNVFYDYPQHYFATYYCQRSYTDSSDSRRWSIGPSLMEEISILHYKFVWCVCVCVKCGWLVDSQKQNKKASKTAYVQILSKIIPNTPLRIKAVIILNIRKFIDLMEKKILCLGITTAIATDISSQTYIFSYCSHSKSLMVLMPRKNKTPISYQKQVFHNFDFNFLKNDFFPTLFNMFFFF